MITNLIESISALIYYHFSQLLCAFSRMSEFLIRLLRLAPNKVHEKVYFCPSKITSLECHINDNGTVSPASCPTRRFSCLNRLAYVWKIGAICSNIGFPKRLKSKKFSFSKDFFFKPNRIDKVSTYMSAVERKMEANHPEEEHGPNSSQVSSVQNFPWNFKFTFILYCSVWFCSLTTQYVLVMSLL